MRKSRLIVLAALELEARAAAEALGVPFVPNAALRHATEAIEVHTIGMGAARLPQLLPLLNPSSADRVWMVGLAGGLDPALRVGDVVIDAELSRPLDASSHRGRIHTSKSLVASPAEKRALFAETAALAIDMEQRIVADILRPLGVVVVGIRAISDTADTPLDPALPLLVNAVGRPKWRALASALLRRPRLLVLLIRLGRDSSRAAHRLTEALARLAASERANRLL